MSLFNEYNSDDFFSAEMNWLYISSCLERHSEPNAESQMVVWFTAFINPSYSDVWAGFGRGLNNGRGWWCERQSRGGGSGPLKSTWSSSFPNSLIPLRAIFYFLLLLFVLHSIQGSVISPGSAHCAHTNKIRSLPWPPNLKWPTSQALRGPEPYLILFVALITIWHVENCLNYYLHKVKFCSMNT